VTKKTVRRESRDPIGPGAGLGDLLGLYGDASWGFRAFLAHRWWHASLPRVERAVPETADVLDIGCGDGVFANLVGLRGPRRRVLGLEKNEAKAARAAGRLSNVAVRTIDALQAEHGRHDTVTLIDVLHHLGSFREQETLLDVVAGVLPPGGTLVLKEVSTAYPLRYTLTTVLDRIAYPADPFFFRHHEQLHDLLAERGFDVRFTPLVGRRPYAHVLLVGVKR
jgi:SAM-dependent methyltransferase